MKFILDFIKRKEKEIINESNIAVTTLNKRWDSFLKKDTYLIYDDKSAFLNLVKKGEKETNIPWYLFWDFKLKSNLQSNFTKLKEYGGSILVYNQNFLIQKKKEYKNLFKKGELTLDDDQQTAIITDDKHNLVVAGAGSGKTEVLITRIAYLIKRKSDKIKPEKILVLAFQNKAANEIKDRIKKRYGVDVEIRTFHSLGNKIIEDASKIKRIKKPTLKEECSKEWKYTRYIENLFNREILKDKKLQNKIINFMKLYGDKDRIKDRADFKKKEEFYKYQEGLKYTALDGNQVNSEAEREILNFFLMHKLNQTEIKILYEYPAEWMKYKNDSGQEVIPKPDFYFPDFDIYLEHWAIGKNGKVPRWFQEENPTKKYIETMNIKKKKFKENNKILFETTYADYKTNNFHKILSQRFLKILKEKNKDKKFELEPFSYKELVEKVWDSAKFVKKMPLNISHFIRIAKTYRLHPKAIEKRLNNENWSSRQSSFTKIANQIYTTYQKELKKGNFIDFSDMINVAVDYIKDNKEFYKDKYDHILIDEYQDISKQRYEMIKELMNKTKKCKLFCVGDDWQSIMGFAGSNLNFFINFDRYFPHRKRTDLTKNYRSIKSIVDIGASIIKKNGGQIKKEVVSHSKDTKQILLYSLLHKKRFWRRYYDQMAKHCIDTIKEYHTTKNYPYNEFMILLRITNPTIITYLREYAETLGIKTSERKEIPNCVRIMSVHKSKGLQAKVVIILNLNKGIYGFPCELENPDIFQPAIPSSEGDGLRDKEERRLFYVAVTRAKEEVIMYTQKCSESEFITEIKDFIKRTELSYEIKQ